MLVSLAAALMLTAAPAKAQPACVSNEMTAAWEKISFALWITDYTIPDSSPRAATLKFQKCERREETLGEKMTPQDVRWYVSEDGSIGVLATVGDDEPGATWLTLVTRNGGNGLTNSAQLGAFAHQRVYWRGLGWDKVSIQDWRDSGRTIVKNVFLIPTDAVIKKP